MIYLLFAASKRSLFWLEYGNFSISAGTAFWIPAFAGMTQRISKVQHVIPAEAGIQAFRNVRLAHRY